MNSLDYYPLAVLGARLVPVESIEQASGHAVCILENLPIGSVRMPDRWAERFMLATPTHVLLAVYEPRTLLQGPEQD